MTPGSVNQEDEWQSLATLSQSGDQKAYRLLFEKLIPILHKFLSNKAPESDREDIVQNILISIHRALHTYNPDRPFLSWFFAIARYRLVDYYRKEGRLVKTIEKITENITNIKEPDEDDFSLEELLTKLPDKQQRVIRLMKLEGLSVREVAQLTGMSESAVKVNAHRGYVKLKKNYRNHEN